MKNNSDNLPFWGKQKPLKHYFHNGCLKFKVSNNELFYDCVLIDKDGTYGISKGNVKDKEHLDRLLRVKDIHEFVTHLV